MPVTRARKNSAKTRRAVLPKKASPNAADEVSMRTRRQPLVVKEEEQLLASFQSEISDLAQQTSDNRVQVPNQQNSLSARKQTPTVESQLSSGGDADSSTRRIKMTSATLADIGSGMQPIVVEQSNARSPSSDQAGSPLVLIVEKDVAASSGGSSSSSNKSSNGNGSRKRKNLLPTPTSGLTATQVVDGGETTAGEDDELTPLSGKRCCKSDLKRCLRVGDWIENIRVPRNILESRNGGKKLLAQFDGQNFIDYQTEKQYRSISDWIKQRMIDLGAISETSNISGWDYAVVHREGRTTTLRLLVEETKQKMEMMRSTMKEQRQSGSPLTPSAFGVSPLGSELPKFGQQKFLPTFGSGSAMIGTGSAISGAANALAISSGNSGALIPNDVLLHSRLQTARQQVAELEQLLYVGRNN